MRGGPRGGPWNVIVERAGDYEITLRRWPFDLEGALDGNIDPPGKALPIVAAQAAVAGQRLSGRVEPRAREITLRARLAAGRTPLQACFEDAAGRDICGAYYAKVTRLVP